MFLKEAMKFRPALALAFLISMSGCKSIESNKFINDKAYAAFSKRFVLPQSVFPSHEIQSLQLHPVGNAAAPPIITLNGSQKLLLAFDHLSDEGQQFRISISHRQQNWQKSPLSPVTFTTGFFEDYFGGGLSSFTQAPSYRHYEYRFPNERLDVTKSGNYLLSVYDSDSNKLLFRIPFFVSENKGHLSTRIQILFANQKNRGSIAQPFSRYQFPAFVTQPRFDLSFSYVPNQFWGRMRSAGNVFYAGRGFVEFHLGRRKAFAGNYNLNVLDLRAFPPHGQEIVDFIPGKTPPAVILRRDVQPFSSIAAPHLASIPGAIHDRQSQYMSVRFSLEPAVDVSTSAKVYLVGSFTNWAIDEQFRMYLDVSDSLWKGNALIKRGLYAYKYILLQDGRVEELSTQSFNNTPQTYLTFVYYRDPELHYDRLLKVGRTVRF